MRGHLTDHHKHHDLRSNNVIHVVGVCSNPARWHSRYRIGREWIKHMLATPCVHLTIVEAVYGDRKHELYPENCEYDYIPLRVTSEAWQKEPMLNLGFRHVCDKYNAQYLGAGDMDVFFRDEFWAQEALHQLQTYPAIQPWQDCADLGPHGGISRHFRSFGFQHQRGVKKQTHPSQPYEYAHTGFFWCYRREFWEQCQGLMDFAILGSADHHMAFGMINEIDKTIHQKMSQSFKDLCFLWQEKAFAATKGNVGFSVGRIEHMWHGPKNLRKYRERWQILIDTVYDPRRHLRRDGQGLLYIVGNDRLEHEIIKYNRFRLEDGVFE